MYEVLFLFGLAFVLLACCVPSRRFVKSKPRIKYEVKILSVKLLTGPYKPKVETPWPKYQSVEDSPYVDG